MYPNGTYECDIAKLSLTLDPKRKGDDDTYSFYKFKVSDTLNDIYDVKF